jgi:hypothetical protein|tara:strand:- start:210 stop:548 length:339 start_codon:yes stop_codon:yes gene_type:complete
MTYPFEFEYEDEGGELHEVEGLIEYDVQDNSFSYDYGEQVNLTHDPGPTIDISDVVIESVTTEILMNPPDEALVRQAIEDHYNDEGMGEILNYDKKLGEEAEAERKHEHRDH